MTANNMRLLPALSTSRSGQCRRLQEISAKPSFCA